MKKNRSANISLYLLPAAILSAALFHVQPARAQLPVTPEQAAQSTLTPYQQARDAAVVYCTQQMLAQNVADAQTQSYLTDCLHAQGIADLSSAAATGNTTAVQQ